MGASLIIESMSVGDFDLDLRNAMGLYGPEYPTLRLFLNVKLMPYRRQQGPARPLTLLQLDGLLTVGTVRLAECHLTPNLYAEHIEFPYENHLEIPLHLASYRVHRIEKLRKGDFVATLELTPVFAIHGEGGAIV